MIPIIIALATAVVISAPARAAVDIQEVTSPGGITAWLVEEPSIPFVAVQLYFKGGASMDLPGKRGATNMMANLLFEGAGDLDAQEFVAAEERLAARFDFDISDDAFKLDARFLTENREASLALWRSALIEPRFDEDALERLRGQTLSDLRFQETQPDDIVWDVYSKMIYGDHPYATKISGDVESLTALTRDDVLAAYTALVTKDKVHVGVVGDITAEELAPMLDFLLGDLPATGPALPDPAEVTFPGGITVIPFDAPQSIAVFGHNGIPWEDPDYFAAFVLKTIVGGGNFESRLMTEVREKRGLTYGIYSYLATRDYADLVQGQFSTSNARMAEAIEVVRAQWQEIAENAVTEEELRVAKTYMTGSYPLRFDGNARIANTLATLQADDFPIDYVLTRNDRVNAVTMEDIQRVAARLFDPEELTFVVIGQPEGLETTN